MFFEWLTERVLGATTRRGYYKAAGEARYVLDVIHQTIKEGGPRASYCIWRGVGAALDQANFPEPIEEDDFIGPVQRVFQSWTQQDGTAFLERAGHLVQKKSVSYEESRAVMGVALVKAWAQYAWDAHSSQDAGVREEAGAVLASVVRVLKSLEEAGRVGADLVEISEPQSME